MFRRLLFAALLFTASPAVASGGWNDINEISEWSLETLLWAQEVHPKHPSIAAIAEVVPPPPEELWCLDEGIEEDCETWGFYMDRWLHRFLGLDQDAKLPENLPPYPKACESTCDEF